MTLINMFNKQVFIARHASVGGDADKLAYVTVTSAMSNIQPVNDFKLAIELGVHGKLHKFWVDGTVDVQDGDSVRDEDGKRYKVIDGGVNQRTQGSIDYKEIWITEVSDN